VSWRPPPGETVLGPGACPAAAIVGTCPAQWQDLSYSPSHGLSQGGLAGAATAPAPFPGGAPAAVGPPAALGPAAPPAAGRGAAPRLPLPRMTVRNTFLDEPEPRSPSLERFLDERKVRSTPVSRANSVCADEDPFAIVTPTGSQLSTPRGSCAFTNALAANALASVLVGGSTPSGGSGFSPQGEPGGFGGPVAGVAAYPASPRAAWASRPGGSCVFDAAAVAAAAAAAVPQQGAPPLSACHDSWAYSLTSKLAGHLPRDETCSAAESTPGGVTIGSSAAGSTTGDSSLASGRPGGAGEPESPTPHDVLPSRISGAGAHADLCRSRRPSATGPDLSAAELSGCGPSADVEPSVTSLPSSEDQGGGSAELPSAVTSAGSVAHHLGTCRPCAFHYKGGCANGEDCAFCHLCDLGEKKRRIKERRSQRRSLFQSGWNRQQEEQVANWQLRSRWS